MSFLTILPMDRYDPQAFAGFDPGAKQFHPGTAYAMAWMCQLAYETADTNKINSIAADWNLTLADGSIISEEIATALPRSSTHLIVCRRATATIITFAGTDPVSLANWITDFDLGITSGGAARGFAEAAQSVWPQIETLLKAFGPAGPIYVTGHSLGASLAAITAGSIERDFPGMLRGVYTFGMPRTGDRTFATAYNSSLGARTFRLVHGEDLVATVPPSKLGSRHVGLLLTCARQGKFDESKLATSTDSDAPSFIDGISRELRDFTSVPGSLFCRLKLAFRLVMGTNAAGMRTDPGGIAIEMLPPRLRDHMPDRYIEATGKT